jgi:hypothetical protein
VQSYRNTTITINCTHNRYIYYKTLEPTYTFHDHPGLFVNSRSEVGISQA